MKQQEVFKKIGGILKELNEQHEYLRSVEGPLNELELELFIANAHFLTDHIVILSKLNHQLNPAPKPVEPEQVIDTPKAVEEPAAPQEEKYFEPLVQTFIPPVKNAAESDLHNDQPAPHIDLQSGALEDSYAMMQEEPETIRHELILDEADWDEEDEAYETGLAEASQEEEIYVPPAILKPLPVEKITDTKIVADRPAERTIKANTKDEVLTINEKISAQLGEKSSRVAEHIHAQNIPDLKTAITLNDKLLYVKDLFNGYSLAYSEAIDILNRFSKFDEADLFLKKNYTDKNNWDDKPETTEKFYALLKRRYE